MKRERDERYQINPTKKAKQRKLQETRSTTESIESTSSMCTLPTPSMMEEREGVCTFWELPASMHHVCWLPEGSGLGWWQRRLTIAVAIGKLHTKLPTPYRAFQIVKKSKQIILAIDTPVFPFSFAGHLARQKRWKMTMIARRNLFWFLALPLLFGKLNLPFENEINDLWDQAIHGVRGVDFKVVRLCVGETAGNNHRKHVSMNAFWLIAAG